jgi:exodeoxyribonuclease VII, large subunit
MNNEVSLTVTDINNYIKNIVDGDFFLSNVTLKGEISNLKFHTRGHLYFSLKDENSKINAVMFNYKNLGLNFIPKDGMNVIVKGKVSVFTTGGSYQITVSNMKEDGIGNLYILFEELKRRLEREGLFSPEHKKKLPRIPKKVGVITASTGAAVKDIISTINRRFPLTEIILFPTLVQGVGAKENIVKMINEANESDVDVIILGRGGGSIEDLWAFNEEIVARAIYNSNKPIVSAVGHEIDFTISDFVSDMRAPTPTGAAELVVPSKVEIQSYLNDYKGRIISVINKKIKSYNDTFSKLKSTYILKNPISMYEIDEQKLDNMLEKLGSIMTYKLEREKSELNNLSKMISPNILNRLDKEKIKLENIETKLNLLNPENILKKGYTLTLVEGKIVKSIKSVKKGSIIDTKFSDGIIKSEVL